MKILLLVLLSSCAWRDAQFKEHGECLKLCEAATGDKMARGMRFGKFCKCESDRPVFNEWATESGIIDTCPGYPEKESK